MSWLYLGIAVVFEIAVAISAGNAKGFTRLWWTVATLVSGAIATFFLAWHSSPSMSVSDTRSGRPSLVSESSFSELSSSANSWTGRRHSASSV